MRNWLQLCCGISAISKSRVKHTPADIATLKLHCRAGTTLDTMIQEQKKPKHYKNNEIYGYQYIQPAGSMMLEEYI